MIYNDLGMSFIVFLMTILSLKYVYILFKATQLINEDVAYAYTQQENRANNYHNTCNNEYRYKREESHSEKAYISIPGKISRFASDLNFFINCDDPYVLLNCSPNDTQKMIKKRYRELVRKWHPDYIRGMGATQAELVEATHIVQIINLAYSDIYRRAA